MLQLVVYRRHSEARDAFHRAVGQRKSTARMTVDVDENLSIMYRSVENVNDLIQLKGIAFDRVSFNGPFPQEWRAQLESQARER